MAQQRVGLGGTPDNHLEAPPVDCRVIVEREVAVLLHMNRSRRF